MIFLPFSPMHVFIYEHITAGGLGPDAPASLLREGRAMRDAIAADFARVPGVEGEIVADDGLRRAGEADGTLVIAPEFGDRLARCSEAVYAAGGDVLGSSVAVVTIAGNKLFVNEWWTRRGVRTPPTVRVAGVERLRDPPWVCKPAQGAGSQATFLVRTRDEWPGVLRAASAEWDGRELLVQPFVPGLAASVGFLCGPGVAVPLLPTAQRLSDDGRFRYLGGRLPLRPDLARRATRLATAAVGVFDGLRGYVGVDLVLGPDPDGGEDYANEINPRQTTSYLGLRQLCADNLAELWLRVLRGERVEPRWQPGVIEFDADGTIRPIA
jgi:predicted ATP-grasp superfamily ATP-dependent carboligase